MKKNILTIALVFFSLCSYAQNIYPLNTFYQDVPDYSYMKDLDNELDPFVGTYKATFNDNEITLYISKQEKFLRDFGEGDKKFYIDRLLIKYVVKNQKGEVLQDTYNNNFLDGINEIISLGVNKFDKNSISMHYRGTNCMIGWGKIVLKIINPNELLWSYYVYDSITSNDECDSKLDTNVYLPNTLDLVFHKQ